MMMQLVLYARLAAHPVIRQCGYDAADGCIRKALKTPAQTLGAHLAARTGGQRELRISDAKLQEFSRHSDLNAHHIHADVCYRIVNG